MQSWGVRGGALQAEADDGRSGSEGAPAEEGHDRQQGRGMPANALPREQRTRCLTSGINRHGAKCGCDVHKHGNRG